MQQNNPLFDAMSDYLAFCRHEKGMTAKSLETYSENLSAFRKWLAANEIAVSQYSDYSTALLRRYLYVFHWLSDFCWILNYHTL